jgi:hypothetical protein
VVLQDGERRELSKYSPTISNAKKSAKLLMQSEDFLIFLVAPSNDASHSRLRVAKIRGA